ncbi:MAG: hypothetical protein M1815_005006 [Lichina confinis]|nr:MAG: hypothetical protein M1815_005006 [Lichina confinis]
MEGVSPTPSAGDAAAASSSATPLAQSTAEQARLRKERREAKIKAGGSARLGRITSMGGRLPEPVQATPRGPSQGERNNDSDPAGTPDAPFSPPPAGATPRQQPQQSGPSESLRREQAERRSLEEMAARGRNPLLDPGLDFQARQQQPSDELNQLLDMMRGAGAGAGGGGLGPDRAGRGLGGGPGQFGGPGLSGGPTGMPPGVPPGLAALLGAQRPPGSFSSTTDVSQAASPNRTSNIVWRVVHALSIILLGAYILQTTAFTGTQPGRSHSSSASSPSLDSKTTSADDGDMNTPQAAPVPFEVYVAGRRISLFTLFMTIETVLQTARFFIEKGRLSSFSSSSCSSSSSSSSSTVQSSTSVDGSNSTIMTTDDIGIVTTILQGLLQVLSEPYRSYLRLLIRYALIFSTMVKDALVLVFVLGVGAWLRT